VNRGKTGTVAVATALATLFIAAFIVARAQGKLPALALDLTEHLFGIVLAVFVFERMLAWREERRWLAAKNWLYMILLETIDDLLKELLPQSVPLRETELEPNKVEEEKEEEGEVVAVYEVGGERIHFGEAVAYSPLRLLVSPDERDLQSYLRWYVERLEPIRYAELARAALSDAREQIRDMFGSSARLMEAEITAMLISFEQAALAAIRHLESATSMREEKLEGSDSSSSGGDGEGDGSEEDKRRRRRRIREEEADNQLAFATSIIVESVVDSAIKPKAWLEEEIESQEARTKPLGQVQVSARSHRAGSTNQRRSNTLG
jgi:hypothetical protein